MPFGKSFFSPVDRLESISADKESVRFFFSRPLGFEVTRGLAAGLVFDRLLDCEGDFFIGGIN
jgi:hypothetical protein